MPKAGYKSITVKDDVYDRCKSYYEENRETLQYVGVTSFTGFMTWLWQLMVSDDYIHDRIKNKLRDRTEAVINLLN